jgi:hypothetical protein
MREYDIRRDAYAVITPSGMIPVKPTMMIIIITIIVPEHNGMWGIGPGGRIMPYMIGCGMMI